MCHIFITVCVCASCSVVFPGLPPDVSASLLSYAKAGGLAGGMPGDMGAAVQQVRMVAAANQVHTERAKSGLLLKGKPCRSRMALMLK